MVLLCSTGSETGFAAFPHLAHWLYIRLFIVRFLEGFEIALEFVHYLEQYFVFPHGYDEEVGDLRKPH